MWKCMLMMWSRWDVVSGGFSGNFMGSCFSIRLPPIFCKNHRQVKFYHNLGECMLSLIGHFTGWHELFNNPTWTYLENVCLMPWESTARRSESNQTRLRSNWNLRPWWMTPIIFKNLWLDWGMVLELLPAGPKPACELHPQSAVELFWSLVAICKARM